MAKVISVAALNKYVKSLLEGNAALADIALRGEISNFNRHYKTGHCYFTLKDETASVKAVMFRSDAQALAFSPENGMRVMARCRVSLYERDGAFQIYVSELFPDGVGAAQIAFEQLKARLTAEGLFLPEHKKNLPAYPKCIGLVTSKTGAALQDILKVAARRNPTIQFLLAPVTVQGEGAAKEIANAILQLSESGRVDAIVVARGGGSAEDLWVFNSEIIARAAFAAKVPLVSAIGHEIDFTILDFVADLRAPTPSAAAEMALPDLFQTLRSMNAVFQNITKNMQLHLDSCYNNLVHSINHSALKKAVQLPVACGRQLAVCKAGILRAQAATVVRAQKRFQANAQLANSLNPYAILARGYSVLYSNKKPVRSVHQLARGQQLEVRLQDGELGCEVQTITPFTENKNG